MKKYIAELLGAFLLTLVVILSLAGQFPVSTPILAGLTLGLFVYTAGGISGAHINPAVTIGIWSLGKITPPEAAKYIVAQFAGALLALWVGSLFTGATASLNFMGGSNTMIVGAAEFLGTIIFTFGIAAVVLGKIPTDITGVVIGGSLLLGLSLAAIKSNAVLNPAVALGIGSFSWMYLLAPIAGSLVGMNLYKWLVGQRSL